MKKNPNDVLKKELVYFLLHSDSSRKSYVKIGKSDSESGVVQRVKGCQTGNPVKLILLGYIEASEREWHYHFRDENIRGEWFDFNYASRFISQLNLNIPVSILKSYKEEKIAHIHRKILKIKDQMDEDRNNYHINLDDEEWNKQLPENFAEELKEIGSFKEDIINIENIKGQKLIEAYKNWSLKNTEEGYHAYERSEQVHTDHRKEALDNMRKIEKIIYFLHKGIDPDKWVGGLEIRLCDSKSTFFDFFNRVVNPGEYYIKVGDYQSGYSLESGLCIYKLFLNFMNSRRSKTWSKFLGGVDIKQQEKHKKSLDDANVEYKDDCPVDITKKLETMGLKSIIDDIKYDIDTKLNIRYFDKNLSVWRNKESEKDLEDFLKTKTMQKRVLNETQ